MGQPTKTWKSVESRIADKLKGDRIPCSGNGRIKGDILHEAFFIEVKHSKHEGFMVDRWMRKSKHDAKKKIPLLVTHLEGRHNYYVTLDIDDFIRIAERILAKGESDGES